MVVTTWRACIRRSSPTSMGIQKHTRAMPDYGSALQFGLSVTPETAQIEAISELVQLEDITGLDLIAIQDHAYNHAFLDTWTLIAFLAAKTRRAPPAPARARPG